MQCLQLTRGEPPNLSVAVTITGSGNSGSCYATINGTKQYSAGTHEVNTGDTITFCVIGGRKNPGWVEIDGTQVLKVTNESVQTYDWTVQSGISTIEIALNYRSWSYGRITVDTNRSHTGGSN